MSHQCTDDFDDSLVTLMTPYGDFEGLLVIRVIKVVKVIKDVNAIKVVKFISHESSLVTLMTHWRLC